MKEEEFKMDKKEPVVPVPASVLVALETICSFTECKTISFEKTWNIINDLAEEVEEGLSDRITASALAYVMLEVKETQGEKVAKELANEILEEYKEEEE